jgi:hypothetical protein
MVSDKTGSQTQTDSQPNAAPQVASAMPLIKLSARVGSSASERLAEEGRIILRLGFNGVSHVIPQAPRQPFRDRRFGFCRPGEAKAF